MCCGCAQAFTFCEVFKLPRYGFETVMKVCCGANANKRMEEMFRMAKNAIKSQGKLNKLCGMDNGPQYRSSKHFMPHSTFRQCWTLIGFIFLMYLIIMLPLRSSFYTEEFRIVWQTDAGTFPWLSIILDIVIDVYFLVDLFFRTTKFAYKDKQHSNIVCDREYILQRYKPLVYVDAFASFPLDHIIGSTLGYQYYSLARLTRLLRLHLFKNYQMEATHFVRARRIKVNAHSLRLCLTLVMFVLLTHIIGSFWHGVAVIEAARGS